MKNSTKARLTAGLSLMALASVSSMAAAYDVQAGPAPATAYTAAQLVDILVPSGSGINVIGGSQSYTGQSGTTGTTTAVGSFTGGLSVNPGPASSTGLTGIPFDQGVIL